MNIFNALVSRPGETNAEERLQGSRQAGNQQQELVLRSAALEATANAVLITTRNGAIHWVNPAFEHMTGYALDEIRGRNPSFLQSGEMEPAFYKSMWETIVGGDVWQGELLNRRKDGSLYTEQMTITPVTDGAGKVTHFIAVKEDITERKRAEDSLRLTQFAIDHAPHSTFWANPGGRFLYVNDTACAALGYSREELLSMYVFDIDVEISREAWPGIWQQLQTSGHFSSEGRQVRKDGTTFPVQVEARCIEFEGRRYSFGVTLDLTERQRAESALRASEAKYRSLFEDAKDPIFISTLDGQLLDINGAASELLGYTKEELMNLSSSSVYWDLAEREALVNALKQDGFVRDFEIGLRHRAGHRITALETAVFERGQCIDQGTYRGILRDVSLERALREQLQQAQKMEAVGQLAGGIAHDFNNLLTAINGYAELGLEEVDADSSLGECFEEIHGAGRRAEALTRQLLAFSRQQVLQPRIIDLNTLITDFASLVRRTLGEEVEVILALDIDVCRVRADPAQMEQVVMNLAVNARDAMAEGGRLTLTTSRVDIAPADVTVAGLAPGQYVTLKVADTGSGISEEVLAHLFEPFFTTKELGRGTGLGLSTVLGIVQQSGGQIQVKSIVGKGSCFVIYLPLVPFEEDDLYESGATASDAVPGGDETILVVEDEGTVRALIRRYLDGLGYRVLEATSGREAVELLSSGGHDVDLVLTDLIMPRMRGTELRQILLETRPGLRFVFMSGYMDQDLIQSGVPDGVPFVAKPFSRESLAGAIRQGLR